MIFISWPAIVAFVDVQPWTKRSQIISGLDNIAIYWQSSTQFLSQPSEHRPGKYNQPLHQLGCCISRYWKLLLTAILDSCSYSLYTSLNLPFQNESKFCVKSLKFLAEKELVNFWSETRVLIGCCDLIWTRYWMWGALTLLDVVSGHGRVLHNGWQCVSLYPIRNRHVSKIT